MVAAYSREGWQGQERWDVSGRDVDVGKQYMSTVFSQFH